MIVVELDVPLVSPNRLLNEHWRSRHHRRARERAEVRRALSGQVPPPPPWHIVITRVSSRTLDAHDALPFTAKAVVDELAAFLGVDDRDPRVTWTYAQEQRREPARWRKTRAGLVRPKERFRVWCRVEIADA